MSRKYQVQPGDVLTKIAQRFYGEATLFGLIAAANQLADPNKIAPGQVLSIPDLPSHFDVVQATGTNQIRATGPLAIQVPCNVPAGMRLVIETVSARCVLQPGVLSPLCLGELDVFESTRQPAGVLPMDPELRRWRRQGRRPAVVCVQLGDFFVCGRTRRSPHLQRRIQPARYQIKADSPRCMSVSTATWKRPPPRDGVPRRLGINSGRGGLRLSIFHRRACLGGR